MTHTELSMSDQEYSNICTLMGDHFLKMKFHQMNFEKLARQGQTFFMKKEKSNEKEMQESPLQPGDNVGDSGGVEKQS